MPYNFAADSFHTKKLCSKLSESQVRFYTENGSFAFLKHTLATYDVYLRLIGKRIVDFLLVLIELFSPGVTPPVVQRLSRKIWQNISLCGEIMKLGILVGDLCRIIFRLGPNSETPPGGRHLEF